MSKYDQIYNVICNDIIQYGTDDLDVDVRTKWKDGTPAHTYFILDRQVKFDNSEVPILTTKKVAWKSAIAELLWIWQMKSNVVQELRDLNMTFNGGKNFSVWDDWQLEDGTIGKAYGYQLGKKCRNMRDLHRVMKNGKIEYQKFDQVDYLLYSLKYNPSSRRHITTLWDADDVDQMSLTPCVWSTHWQSVKGKLHLTVNIRSNDFALGNPFNVFQYYVLQRMVAQVTNHELGWITFNIDNVHLYDRHIEPIQEQIGREQFEAPELWINPDITNFYDFTLNDFDLVGYTHGDKLPMEIAL